MAQTPAGLGAREAELGPLEVAAFRAGLARLHPVDDEAFAACVPHCRVRALSRGEYVLRAGERATHSGLVMRGLLREHFVLEDGTERTKAFVSEGEPTGSLADLLSGHGSRAFIVAEEPSLLLTVPFARMQELVVAYPAWRDYGEALLKMLFIRKAEREYELLGLDAEARYRVFLDKHPGLGSRVTARHIASYLGITPVHLSRIRSRGRSP